MPKFSRFEENSLRLIFQIVSILISTRPIFKRIHRINGQLWVWNYFKLEKPIWEDGPTCVAFESVDCIYIYGWMLRKESPFQKMDSAVWPSSGMGKQLHPHKPINWRFPILIFFDKFLVTFVKPNYPEDQVPSPDSSYQITKCLLKFFYHNEVVLFF